MGQSAYRQPRMPGPTGLTRDRRRQNPSRFCSWPATGAPGSAQTLCAQIFFATDEDVLLSDDLNVIRTVGLILDHLHTVGDAFVCVCKGNADVRHEFVYNLNLSRRRANAVADELRGMLPASCASWVKVEALGESKARTDPGFWAEDRRVDILVECQSARLHRPSVGFEAATDNNTEGVFVKDLERMEINSSGVVKTWVRDEIDSLHKDVLHKSKRTSERFSPVIQRLSTMSLDEYVKELRSRTTAFVRVTYQFVDSRKVHRVSAQIHDTVTLARMFVEESVEAPVLLDVQGTSYLSSPQDNPVQVWRHLAPGQAPPAGATTRTSTGGPVGLIGRPDDLYRKLCAGFPNITQRVASKLTAP